MIGIFDSGSGGLSVFSALRARAPEADIVYFGDIRHAPYGSKSPEELADLVRSGIQILTAHGATEIIVACNSVSLSVLSGAAGSESFVEMSRPTARMMRAHAGKRILLLATPATLTSGIYRDALWSIVSLDECALPDLARAIEEEEPEAVIRAIVREALQRYKGRKYDAIFLGCTHYPLVSEIISRESKAFFGDIPLIDPAEAVVSEALERFNCAGKGTSSFLISRDSHGFRNRIAPWFLEYPSTLTIV